MVNFSLIWDLRVQGAQQAREELNKTAEAFARGEASAEQMDRAIKGYEKSATEVLRTQRAMNNEWKVTHPNLAQLSVGLDKVSSAAYRLKSIYDTVNLAFIRQNTGQVKEAQMLNQKAILARELADIQNSQDYDPNNPTQKELELKQQIAEIDASIQETGQTQLGSILDTILQVGITVPLAVGGIKSLFEAANSLSKVQGLKGITSELGSIIGLGPRAATAVAGVTGAPIKPPAGGAPIITPGGTPGSGTGFIGSTAGIVTGGATGAVGIGLGSYGAYQAGSSGDFLGILQNMGISVGIGAAGGAMIAGVPGALVGAGVGAVSSGLSGLAGQQQLSEQLDAQISATMEVRIEQLKDLMRRRGFTEEEINKINQEALKKAEANSKNIAASSKVAGDYLEDAFNWIGNWFGGAARAIQDSPNGFNSASAEIARNTEATAVKLEESHFGFTGATEQYRLAVQGGAEETGSTMATSAAGIMLAGKQAVNSIYDLGAWAKKKLAQLKGAKSTSTVNDPLGILGGGGSSKGSSTTSSSSTSSYKGLTGAAAEAAKAAGFAEGGIVKEPTLLMGLESGSIGLMAEEGPEAIMPLEGGSGRGGTTIINHTIIHINADVIDSYGFQKFAERISRELAIGYNRRIK